MAPKKSDKKDEKKAPPKVDKKVKNAKAKEADKPTEYERGDPRRLLKSPAMDALRKQFGNKKLGTTGRQPLIPRLSSGIAPLDKALGGGWAKGYWHLLWGGESSTKTTTVLRTLGVAQRTCRNCNVLPEIPKQCGCGNFKAHVCAYIRLEDYDALWASRFLDVDNLVLFEPINGEEALDCLDVLTRSGDADCIALDSIAFLTPQAEIDNATAKEFQGLQSRIVGKGVRKTNAGMNATAINSGFRPTVFLTNQIRFKIGVMFGDPRVQPGGQAPLFAAGTEVYFGKGDYNTKKDDVEKIATHADFDFKITKNKTGTPKMEGTYRMAFPNSPNKKWGEVIDEPWLIEQGLRAGFVTLSTGGAMYTIMKHEPVRGLGTAVELLQTDRKLHRDLTDTLMAWFEAQRNLENTVVSTIPADDPGMGGEGNKNDEPPEGGIA